MDLFDKYLYLWGSLIGIAIVSSIYYFRKDLRREILLTGIATAIVGVLLEYFFFQDYWNPTLLIQFGDFGGLEDVIFGFSVGGIGAILYNVIFKVKLVKTGKSRHWIILLVLFSQILSILVFSSYLGLNSIYSSAIGWVVPSIVIAITRKDLVIEMVIVGILGGVLLVLIEGVLLIFSPEYLQSYYLLYGTAPVVFGIFPVTELIWGISFGALISPLFEYYEGLKQAKK
ncbi:MAG TPA: hypothetical protein ENI23_08555 [bacterium]|nr:hypothetical protein [bacterium]